MEVDAGHALTDNIGDTKANARERRVRRITVTTSRSFGRTPDDRPVEVLTLVNGQGMTVEVLTYGGVLRAISVPDANGRAANVVLGFGGLDDYLVRSPYFGAIVGRFANRIANAEFVLDGARHRVSANVSPDSLHGGGVGFDKQVWQATLLPPDASTAVRLTNVSPDGDQGFPGTLETSLTYRLLDEANTLRIEYRAETDKPTVVNLTNHSYFNLAGEGSGSVLGHELYIAADHYLPVTERLLPTGELLPVAGTAFDFTVPHRIGERIRDGSSQLVLGQGYDHTYVLNRPAGSTELGLAARVAEPSAGRILEVWTTEPGLDFYSGNLLDGTLVGSGGRVYRQSDGFALEPEHFSDSPNQPRFPSTVLRPGEVYESVTEFRFSATDPSVLPGSGTADVPRAPATWDPESPAERELE